MRQAIFHSTDSIFQAKSSHWHASNFAPKVKKNRTNHRISPRHRYHRITSPHAPITAKTSTRKQQETNFMLAPLLRHLIWVDRNNFTSLYCIRLYCINNAQSLPVVKYYLCAAYWDATTSPSTLCILNFFPCVLYIVRCHFVLHFDSSHLHCKIKLIIVKRLSFLV